MDDRRAGYSFSFSGEVLKSGIRQACDNLPAFPGRKAGSPIRGWRKNEDATCRKIL